MFCLKLKPFRSLRSRAFSTSRCNQESALRRSVLYMPASNQRALDKAETINSDAFIFDLEDAVAPDQKVTARKQAIEASNKTDKFIGKEIVIRVNGHTTDWFKDDVVSVVTQSSAAALLIPKVESPEDVKRVEDIMEKTGKEMKIWCMIETPKGVLNAHQITASSHRIDCLVLGTVDLSNDIRCKPSSPGRWNIMSSLQHTLLAARSENKTVIDGVFVDLKDDVGFRDECIQGVELGFDGKSLIHPKTVEVTNEVFSPTDKQVEHAKSVVAAHEEAIKSGAGIATVNGKLIENLHVRDAHRILAFSEQIQLRSINKII